MTPMFPSGEEIVSAADENLAIETHSMRHLSCD